MDVPFVFDEKNHLPEDTVANRQIVEQEWHQLRENFSNLSVESREQLYVVAASIIQVSQKLTGEGVGPNEIMTTTFLVAMAKIHFENVDADKEIDQYG